MKNKLSNSINNQIRKDERKKIRPAAESIEFIIECVDVL